MSNLICWGTIIKKKNRSLYLEHLAKSYWNARTSSRFSYHTATMKGDKSSQYVGSWCYVSPYKPVKRLWVWESNRAFCIRVKQAVPGDDLNLLPNQWPAWGRGRSLCLPVLPGCCGLGHWVIVQKLHLKLLWLLLQQRLRTHTALWSKWPISAIRFHVVPSIRHSTAVVISGYNALCLIVYRM